MRWWLAAMGLTAAAGCSNLTDEGGVAGLEIRLPDPLVVEVGQTIVLRGWALNAQGDSVAGTVTWLTPDTTVILTTDGHLTGRTGGSTAQVQAQIGTLVSDFRTFTVNARPDTLVITGDSVLTVATGTTGSAPLLASLQSFDPAGPLSARVIAYRIVAPVFADPAQRSVELPGGVLALEAETGSGGTPLTPVTVSRVAGQATPDSAIVTVAAATATGAVVPGSGQRFIVRFQ